MLQCIPEHDPSISTLYYFDLANVYIFMMSWIQRYVNYLEILAIISSMESLIKSAMEGPALFFSV